MSYSIFMNKKLTIKKANAKQAGFTLVELVVVMVTIGILVAVLIPTFSSVLDAAERTTDVQLMNRLNTQLVSGEITKEDLYSYGLQISGWKLAYSKENNEVVIVDEAGSIVAAAEKSRVGQTADSYTIITPKTEEDQPSQSDHESGN